MFVPYGEQETILILIKYISRFGRHKILEHITMKLKLWRFNKKNFHRDREKRDLRRQNPRVRKLYLKKDADDETDQL